MTLAFVPFCVVPDMGEQGVVTCLLPGLFFLGEIDSSSDAETPWRLRSPEALDET